MNDVEFVASRKILYQQLSGAPISIGITKMDVDRDRSPRHSADLRMSAKVKAADVRPYVFLLSIFHGRVLPSGDRDDSNRFHGMQLVRLGLGKS